MNRQRIVGVFGGSFNPVHNGHMIVASYIAQWTEIDEVLLMLSPLNPFKQNIAPPETSDNRLQMLRIAAANTTRIDITDIQLHLPIPSYTIEALDALAAVHPDNRYKCIIGSDSWSNFDKWKDSDRIIADYGVIIYPRPGIDISPEHLPEGVEIVNAPTISISSTFVRQAIAQGHDMNFFLPQGVFEYIKQHKLYATEQ